jgi:copper resistance protein B
VEFNAALQAVPAFGVGSGLNDIEVGARARYEFRREFAPYVGFNWRHRTGGTAALVRRAGESVGEGSIVLGLRLWK